VSASDAIAGIASETNDAAGRMIAGASFVSSSMESVAAVSQENSAAAEEVSAATEEMSAQAEQVVASAATLADMAADLDSLVARFTLDDSTARAERSKDPTTSVSAERSRASDWGRQAA
jgi:methyl-accepting chemotaxis protein